ncbi:hypothetical protein ACFXPS_05715 [Nocardia sp. NPDC059091]|uniref:acyl-CoA-like ligand-binding transcription factor n=1 Tax=unclassified Nocardia TaxID=2637762 RepID=UPI00369CCB8E
MSPVQRVATALREGLIRIYATERDVLLIRNQLVAANPSLRARLSEMQAESQQVFIDALTNLGDDPAARFRTSVIAAACQAAATVAVLTWAERDGNPELLDLLDEAFSALIDTGQPTNDRENHT